MLLLILLLWMQPVPDPRRDDDLIYWPAQPPMETVGIACDAVQYLIASYNGRHGYFANGATIPAHQAFLVRIGSRWHIAVPGEMVDDFRSVSLLRWDRGCS